MAIGATAINAETNEVVELKKKDAHALGLLCYAEAELQNRICDHINELCENQSVYGQVYKGTFSRVSDTVMEMLDDIINDIAAAMIMKAKGKQ